MRILLAVLIIVLLFSFAFSGFFAFKNYYPDNTSPKKYIVVEEPAIDGKDGLNIIDLRLEEYSTPTPIPTEPPPVVDLPTPTEGPSPTPAPTRPPTPTPTVGPPPTAVPTSPPPPPPPPPPYVPNFSSMLDSIIQFFLK